MHIREYAGTYVGGGTLPLIERPIFEGFAILPVPGGRFWDHPGGPGGYLAVTWRLHGGYLAVTWRLPWGPENAIFMHAHPLAIMINKDDDTGDGVNKSADTMIVIVMVLDAAAMMAMSAVMWMEKLRFRVVAGVVASPLSAITICLRALCPPK